MSTTLLPSALYLAAQVRELDRQAIEICGIPGYTLMCRAGDAAWQIIQQSWPKAQRIVVLCGGGNNAGDGYVLARLAQKAGLEVSVLALKSPEQLSGDALRAFSEAHAEGVLVEPFHRLPDADVLVDAIFGTGLDREVTGQWREAIEAMNRHGAAVLALDIPSGLHADSGIALGAAVEAGKTISFIGLKQGLFTAQGPAYCGTIHFADLAVPETIYATQTPACYLDQGSELAQQLPPRRRDSHKGANGHVLVIGGETGMAGAARMAAEAAARVGAGLVSVATRSEHAGLQTAARPELMFRGVETRAELSVLLERASVIALGPGLGTSGWGQLMLEHALSSALPMVVDADALNLLAQMAERIMRRNWVLTPHPGEAARLLASNNADVQNDRFRAVAEIVAGYGGVCVLKGAGTLVADAEQTSICHAGNPGMGSGGMGDVLTGVIAGLMAQGLGSLDAARSGVFLHARAADLAARQGERGLLASDLFPFLRQLVNP